MQVFVIFSILLVVIFLFLSNLPLKPVQWLSQFIVRVAIAVMLLFFTNLLGGYIGLHIPINLFTVSVSTVLGVLGILSLAAIQIFIF